MNEPNSTHNAEMLGQSKSGILGNRGKVVVFGAVSLGLLIWASAPIALVVGVLFAAVIGHPFLNKNRKITKWLLQGCVVLLGFSMDLPLVLRVGYHGILFTLITIVGILILGTWLGARLRIGARTSLLISVGTAICGGSAIAAVSAVIGATEAEVAVSIGTIFLLNTVALYLFPLAGHLLHLSQLDFGLWAGIAIHDISSVVAATINYGPDALQSAMAIKLSRTLWIIPLTLGIAYMYEKKASLNATNEGINKKTSIYIPWFIGFFLLASLLRSYVPIIATYSGLASHIARLGMVLLLFLIGASISVASIRNVGWRAMLSGIILWVFISIGSLIAILGLNLKV